MGAWYTHACTTCAGHSQSRQPHGQSAAGTGNADASTSGSGSGSTRKYTAGTPNNSNAQSQRFGDPASRITVDIRGASLESDWNVYVKRQDEGRLTRVDNGVRSVSTTVQSVAGDRRHGARVRSPHP
jgi:hypothetical protein